VPGELLLGDPGARDAALHAVQACIPHKTLIPTGVERISTGLPQRSVPLFLQARERMQDGNTFVYDLQLVDAQGCIAERWEGVRFHAVDDVNQESWSIPLFRCYVERRVQQLIPGSHISVAFDVGEETDRRAHTAEAIWKAIDEPADILWRPDGKPQVNNHHTISASHTGNLTFAIAGDGPLGCDIEQVEERSTAVWQNLLGHRVALAQVLAGTTGEDYSTTATRLWTANECLKKAGAGFDSPLLVVNSESDGWVLLSSGHFKLASYVGRISGLQKMLALAVLAQSKNAFL
jgi:enediyne polyketide synthase